MSNRTVKKIKEHFKKDDNTNNENEEIEEIPQKNNKMFFMMLNEDENNEEDSEPEKSDSKQDEKPENNENKQQKPKKKTKKNKKKKTNPISEESKEKYVENPAPELEEYKKNEIIELDSCLDIKLNLLNYNKELSKYFKNAKMTEDAGQGSLSKKEQKQMKMMKKRQYAANKKYYLSYTTRTFSIIPEKFECEKISTDEFGNSVFAFLPSKKYLLLQETYENLKNTNDPNNIFDFLNMNPFHIDCLYDVGEYFRLKGDYKQANSLLEQILFLYEESFGYAFGSILTENHSKIILSWNHNPFSKTLFNTLVKFIDILGKKACYKAALEYNKFLIKLNPYLDPVGALLIIDYNAIIARKYDYLLFFTERFCKEIYNKNNYSILYLPNFIYSCALAKFSILTNDKKKKNEKETFEKEKIDPFIITEEDFKKAIDLKINHLEENHNVLLIIAVLLYPEIITKIINENEFSKQNLSHSSFKNFQTKNYKEILSNSLFSQPNKPFYNFLQLENDDDFQGISKVVELYVERTKLIWKSNPINMWIKGIIGFIINEISENKFNYSDFYENLCVKSFDKNIPFKIGRYKQLTKHSLIEQMQRLDLNNIPDNEANPNNANYNPLNMNQGFLSLLLNSLMPWNHLPSQNQNNENIGQDEQEFFDQ